MAVRTGRAQLCRVQRRLHERDGPSPERLARIDAVRVVQRQLPVSGVIVAESVSVQHVAPRGAQIEVQHPEAGGHAVRAVEAEVQRVEPVAGLHGHGEAHGVEAVVQPAKAFFQSERLDSVVGDVEPGPAIQTQAGLGSAVRIGGHVAVRAAMALDVERVHRAGVRDVETHAPGRCLARTQHAHGQRHGRAANSDRADGRVGRALVVRDAQGDCVFAGVLEGVASCGPFYPHAVAEVPSGPGNRAVRISGSRTVEVEDERGLAAVGPVRDDGQGWSVHNGDGRRRGRSTSRSAASRERQRPRRDRCPHHPAHRVHSHTPTNLDPAPEPLSRANPSCTHRQQADNATPCKSAQRIALSLQEICKGRCAMNAGPQRGQP